MSDEIEIPYPEIERLQEDKSIKEQYQELVAREQREADAAQQKRLEQINHSGDISELLGDMKLRVAFTEKHGLRRWSELHQAHLRKESAARHADSLTKKRRQQVSTTQSRLQALNKARKAQ